MLASLAPLLTMVATVGALGQSAAVRERLDAHRHAQSLAVELVRTVFDLQLRQLEENGLVEHSIYTEIRQSRNSIDRLASSEMEQLTELLSKLQTADDNETLHAEARIAARRVAVAMIAERQRLQSRVRASRTLGLLRQMIALEERTIIETEALKSQPAAEQQRRAKQIAQTHLDLAVLLEQLMPLLDQATATTSQDRVALAAARKQIADDNTWGRIRDVLASLDLKQYDKALEHQRFILKSLEETRRLLQSGQQLEEQARQDALKSIAAAIKQQKRLREQAAASELSDGKQRDQFANEQRHISAQLEQLRTQLGQPIIDAVVAAKEAAQHLADGAKQQAVEKQDAVLKLLDEVSQQLLAQASDQESMADRVADLQELSLSLEELVEQQVGVSELVEGDPESAAEIEAAIAEALEEADDASRLSNEVEGRLDEAQEAVAKAQKALEDGSPSSEQNRLQAVEDAEQSLMEAAAQVQSQLAEAQQALEAATPSENDSASDSTSKNEASSGTTRDSGSTAISEQAVDVNSRSFENEAWFTRLPASLQNRIRASTRRPAPRGYEARLQRYFETSD